MVSSPEVNPKPVRRRRLWTVLAFVLLGAGVAFFLTLQIALHRASPILRARVINTLGTRFDSRVELPVLEISAWNGIEVTGKGLKLYPHSLDRDQPAFSAGRFEFHTHWWNLLRSPMHISDVHVEDLEIYRPDRQQRARMKQEGEQRAQEPRRARIEIYVEKMEVDQATLLLASDRPGKEPLTFHVHALELEDVGRGTPMRFHATLVNPKPIGNIDSSGYFGPFDVHEPGNSPVRGNYSFSHADLNTIRGIGGMLSSTGRYAGELASITVDGETDTPNFSLDTSGSRPVRLHTRFHAVVDGMNGNTYLEPVEATLEHSHIVARGAVTRAPFPGVPGRFGRNVRLDVVVSPAEVADMLRLAVKTNPPIMRGALHLRASFELPPGPETVPERMRLRGRFQIDGATFSNPRVQADVNQLSLRGQGLPAQANADRHAGGGSAIASAMEGGFTLADARLTLAGLHYVVPGADIAVDGVYSLDGKQFDFRGDARLRAKPSQMVTGWRSLLLMPIDPLFARHGAGTEVPFTISGTRSDPKFGVDIFGHHVGVGTRKP